MSLKSASSTADNRLKKLRKAEGNMTCPNCGTKAQSGIGFGNVCVKFKTFICDACKTSHQAISHRVKSITMSNWTDSEVDELLDQNGGGNDACRHIWLGKAPAIGGRYAGGTRPKEGDRIEIFKKFVMDCYDGGIFRADSPYVPGSSSHSHAPATAPATVAPPTPTPTRTPASSAKSAPLTDLVSFDDPFGSTSATGSGGFDAFGFPVTAAASTSHTQPTASKPSASIKSNPSTSASTKKQIQEVDLLSYEEVAAPPLSSKNDNSLLDLLSLDQSLPAAPSGAPKLSLSNPPSSVSSAGNSPLPPAPPLTHTPDPFGLDLLQPISAPAPASTSAKSTGISLGTGMGSGMGMGPGFGSGMGNGMGNGMGSGMGMGMGSGIGYAPRPPMMTAGAGYGTPPQRLSPVPMGVGVGVGMGVGMGGGGMGMGMGMGGPARGPTPMMGGVGMGPSFGTGMGMGMGMGMGGGASAISSIGQTPMGMPRPYPYQTQQAQQPDQFSFLQETMKKHLDGSGPR